MKNLVSIISACLLFITACQSNSVKEAKSKIDSTITSGETNNTSASECYQYLKNRDSAFLTLKIDGDQFTGALSYNLFEKDKNAGNIAGIVKGDTLIAEYTFQSEGSSSTRQVAWLKQGDRLQEGFGDVEEVDGKTRFKNTSTLKFGEALVFSKTSCK
ncbi:hypothetical protein [Pedobacter rhizosphaerae]|uniref:Lipoprotein n=1 Tax=Pedobacter rhizosphaerae TaxID=390241 RepID=A0A1H9NCI4_9SPHI|nr:hypothetical protein [Pedobacter rhizosphaerae]SER33379.1 hypothetical protein SAMN04488023_107151 [Pedobacter rhizosphaerae]